MRTGAKALGLLLLAAVAAAPAVAGAFVVERVVATVGDQPILLSELQSRARPFLRQVMLKVPPGAHQTAAQSQVMKDLLDKMVDESLEARAAAEAHVTVAETEVRAALATIAASQGLTVRRLFAEAEARSGLCEEEYHDEIARQLLEGKMLELRVKGRVRAIREEVRGRQLFERMEREKRKWLDELRAKAHVTVRL
jgi:peptidyl-prolyl cis-trans isomerase SurA